MVQKCNWNEQIQYFSKCTTKNSWSDIPLCSDQFVNFWSCEMQLIENSG